MDIARRFSQMLGLATRRLFHSVKGLFSVPRPIFKNFSPCILSWKFFSSKKRSFEMASIQLPGLFCVPGAPIMHYPCLLFFPLKLYIAHTLRNTFQHNTVDESCVGHPQSIRCTVTLREGCETRGSQARTEEKKTMGLAKCGVL